MTRDRRARSPGSRATPGATRQAGAEGFAALVRDYQRPLFGFIYGMVGDADEAADLTQETFLRAYRARPGTPDDLHARGWLHAIARNCCRDALRRRRLVHWQAWDAAAAGVASGEVGPERAFLREEERSFVQGILARMSPRNRRALVLRAYEGLACREVGAAMGVTDGAAKATLFRARAEFRRIVKAGAEYRTDDVGGER